MGGVLQGQDVTLFRWVWNKQKLCDILANETLGNTGLLGKDVNLNNLAMQR